MDAAQSKTAPKPLAPAETKKRAEDDAPPPPAQSGPPSNFRPFSLSFRFEKELNRVVVKVIDPETGELLREIPPEAVIDALKQLRKAPGALVDEEV
ncbi:MAG: flagellar protein FlaG [Deltaproteobacteria bacterium]|nr:flagellar protein FlaG [Deltaproteobacteria bacterium]